MNSDTKKHIDSARQILVGVVPNPTSQIDQITNALIYKFMDDMDQSAIINGDEPSFFVGDLERYAWTRLMDSKVGNQDRMNLYQEALIRLSESAQLPELFRNIFKSAFLPYRSPETLGLFLKEINFFDYSHPEELGNAYEYLLSVMSSQGDAGQFRTPRHIIDFIVDVVDPTKDDKILDPACGTGGFLVKSYEHILQQHDRQDDPDHKEKPLLPDERRNLMNNFEGYDIDPTMVRIAQVNMYLHQFKNPQIFQCDSLSSDDRWNDKFDVILANPPFMSPRGGIRPHAKFSIPSTRSEVLFVDYIMNHLRPSGRAGIIVPEGVIFQSGTAYKQLRKSLVEDGLYAVVSLPSGVFAPYSGVKTSILLFNNELAKMSQEILFVKVENDGFDLGAQRRTITKNDLPTALDILNKWNTGEKVENKLAVYVGKAKIAENGDYNLSGDRYRVAKDYTNAKWPMVKLGEVVEIFDNKRKPITKSDRIAGQFPYYGATGILDYVHDYIFNERLVLIGEDGAKWDAGEKTAFIAEGKFWVNNHAHVVRPMKDKLIDTFLVSYLNSIDLSPFITGVTVPKLNQEKLRLIKIPLPPLEIQEQIVAELDGYSAIISGAKQITQNWKPKINKDIKIVPVRDRIITALERLIDHDMYLIENDANERTITAKLASYLQEEFASWDVDHEYNREDDANSKRIDDKRVIPDIIVHERGTSNNYVAIEVKKDSSNTDSDIEKLKHFVSHKGYRNAYMITLTPSKQPADWIETIVEGKILDTTTSWPMVKLGDVCDLISGYAFKSEELKKVKSSKADLPVVKIGNIGRNGDVEITDAHYYPYNKSLDKFIVQKDDILIAMTGATVGKVAVSRFDDLLLNQRVGIVKSDDKKISKYFLKSILFTNEFYEYCQITAGGGAQGNISPNQIKEYLIPLPPLEIQEQIVEEIEAERTLVESSKKLIDIYETKTKEVISKLWNE